MDQPSDEVLTTGMEITRSASLPQTDSRRQAAYAFSGGAPAARRHHGLAGGPALHRALSHVAELPRISGCAQEIPCLCPPSPSAWPAAVTSRVLLLQTIHQPPEALQLQSPEYPRSRGHDGQWLSALSPEGCTYSERDLSEVQESESYVPCATDIRNLKICP